MIVHNNQIFSRKLTKSGKSVVCNRCLIMQKSLKSADIDICITPTQAAYST